MLKTPTVICAAILVIFTATTKGQTFAARAGTRASIRALTLDITLPAGACADVHDVLVVMNGDENKTIDAEKVGKCHWKAAPGSFDTELSWFSLRLGVARTVCAYSKAERQRQLGALSFERWRTGARMVKVSTLSSREEIPVSYTREVPENADGNHAPGCTEVYSFAGQQPVPISSVWFPSEALPAEQDLRPTRGFPPAEMLRLQLGLQKADAKKPGLILNHPSVTKYLDHGNGVITVSQMREAYRTQCALGQGSMPPTFSADGYLVDPEKRGLKSIRMSLEK
ncbi:MAG TPA: hypothetical protein VGQ46_04310 [Thermoanaerobaculia bacterium]|jgi:hypothetical protein|nr:hypothetical protein [Thermoanaerobaculia bacterium]